MYQLIFYYYQDVTDEKGETRGGLMEKVIKTGTRDECISCLGKNADTEAISWELRPASVKVKTNGKTLRPHRKLENAL